MPHILIGGPLGGGSFAFDGTPPRSVAIEFPARCGGPGVGVIR